MKKHILGILLVLVVLVALCAVSVSAETVQDVDFSKGGTVNGWCQQCKTNVDWLPLTQAVMDGWGKNYDPTNGTHYYVSYTEEGQTRVKLPGTSGLEIGAGEELCLHLNGKKLLRDGPRGFGLTGTLNIMDHAAQEGSVVAYAKTDSTGMVVRLNTSGAKCNLYGGTLQMLTGSSAYAKSGGCVYGVSGTAFTMYGGTLTGGIAQTGGNLYVASGATAQLLGGTITGGTASYGDKLGGNVYCAGQLTLGNCDVTGGTAGSLGSDLYFNATGKLTVKSDFAGETKAAFNAAHLPASLADGYLTDTLDGCEGAFTGKLFLEKDGARYTLYGKENDTKLYVTGGDEEEDDEVVIPEGALELYCEKCKTNKIFLPLTADVIGDWGTNYSEANGTHYYVAEEEVKLTSAITIAAGEELCLHLNGNTLYRGTIRAFNLNGTMSIMDHAANEGLLYAYAESSSTGGVIRIGNAAGVLNLYGGTLEMKTGSYANCVSGGTVYMINGSTFNMYGGTLAGGKAECGGNLYIGEKAKFTMTGGTMTGGVAVKGRENSESPGMGGNIFIAGSAQVNISNATLTKGQAVERGGNLVTTATNITLNITDSVISDGVCNKHGGNMYLNNGYITIKNTAITGGQSKGSGGNIITYVGATKAENYLKLLGCTVTDGTAGTWGGNVYVSGNSSGTGVLTLGNCTITGGTCGNTGENIFVVDSGKVVVTKDFAGETSVRFNSKKVTDPVRGGKVDTTAATCEGPFTGKLFIENDIQWPAAYGKEGDNTLYIKAAAVVNGDGTKVWYDSNEAAVAAYTADTAYLAPNQGALELTGGDYIVDLGGQNVNVTGTGNVTFFDSANVDFKTYGTATVTGVTVKNTAATEVAGKIYYTVKQADAYSFHLLDTALVNVNIRPSNTGIYYGGTWECDELLKTSLIESYGVAVSLSKFPGKNFMKDKKVLYTEYSADTLTAGTTRTGVLVTDILDAALAASANDANGKKPIYARTFVKLTDGTVVLSESGAAESLHSAMTALDTLVKTDNDASRAYLHSARDFYYAWEEKGMSSWQLKNLPIPEKVEDGVLNLLMMPNSYAYYYVEELYALLAENLPEGITEVNVYNAYHSGCSAENAGIKWKNNEPYFTIFRTNKDGRVALTDQYTATIEEALALEDWDYIHLHGALLSGTDYPNVPANGSHLKVAAAAEPLLDRFHDLYPHAQLLWQRTWCSEIGRSDTWTEEYSKGYDIGMQYISDYMCNEWDLNKPYDLVQVNSGASWTKVRAAEGVDELLPFGGLCARLGYDAYGENLPGYTGPTANSGDGYHEGDIGGAQLLNAYSWYETLTGKDCRETVYRPVYTKDGVTYTLPEELVKIMQDAVHDTVSKMPETVKPAV